MACAREYLGDKLSRARANLDANEALLAIGAELEKIGYHTDEAYAASVAAYRKEWFEEIDRLDHVVYTDKETFIPEINDANRECVEKFIEDTGCTEDDLAKKFGRSIAQLVQGVTKITQMKFTSKEEQQSENVRKMLLAMSDDIRVIIIKLADRLHNMRTIDAQSEHKQREKAHETLEIYAPIAHRLGISAVKEELEDLAIYCA